MGNVDLQISVQFRQKPKFANLWENCTCFQPTPFPIVKHEGLLLPEIRHCTIPPLQFFFLPQPNIVMQKGRGGRF